MNVALKRAALACSASLVVSSVMVPSARAQRFFYTVPAESFTVTKNVQYGMADTAALRMDVYRPAGVSTPSPALIFFNQAVGEQRASGFYVDWARAAASKGLVAIVPDLHGND